MPRDPGGKTHIRRIAQPKEEGGTTGIDMTYDLDVSSLRGRAFSKATALVHQKTKQHDLPTTDHSQVRSNKRKKRPRKNKWTNCSLLQYTLALIGCYYFLTHHAATPADTLVSQKVAESSPRQHSGFPQYGTTAFSQMCSWTMKHEKQQPDCTFLVRPQPRSNEGISAYMSELAAAFIYGLQLDCQLLLDYGPSVKVEKVMQPVEKENNWTVPQGFDCTKSNRCFQVSGPINARNLQLFRQEIGEGGRWPAVPIPFFHYRSAYSPSKPVDLKLYRDVEGALPGFHYETGMACSLNSVFRLSPSASEFVPNLFANILPTLRDPSSFVIALYFRTGQSDGRDNNRIDRNAINCALHLEEDWVSKGSFSRVVWMVVTDAPNLRRAIVASMGRQHNETQFKGKTVPREILTTPARGVHTKPNSKPETADFAEAVIDWYLLGESDVLVSAGGPTFGATAALRTATPLYWGRNDGCYKREIPMGARSNTSLVYPW